MKTVLVTGGSSGIGKETARRLAADGHTVYAAARRLDKMADLEPLGITPLRMDITRDEDVVRVVDRIAAERGGIDVLVNNAGFATYGSIEDTSIDDARYQFEVNLFGLARLTQLALPSMREKRTGMIVNISSMGGKIYTPMGAWYHATKHALEGWSDCLRFELAPFGIHVVIIEPGLIKTEFGDVMVGPLLERSGETAYAPVAKRIADATRNTYNGDAHSSPTVVATAISKAVHASRPKTRYAVGRMARSSMWARTFLGDRAFDWILRSRM